jgi:hypothetical protein
MTAHGELVEPLELLELLERLEQILHPGSHIPRGLKKGNKKKFSQERFLASKPTADSGGGIPNYKFPFFGLLTIGTTGTIGTRVFLNVLNGAQRLNGLNDLNGLRLPLDLPAKGRPGMARSPPNSARWRATPPSSLPAPARFRRSL